MYAQYLQSMSQRSVVKVTKGGGGWILEASSTRE